MIKRVESCGNFVGFKVFEVGHSVLHLQYADDTLIFCEAEERQVSNVARFLEYCEVALGLKVNFHKMSLIGINCSSAYIQLLASCLGCKVGSFPFTYLGLPISDLRLSILMWDKVVERVQVKLYLWKPK
ncbi:hypothetical protein AMTRI_Chr12g272490 [Amborella trichopoda]